MGKYIFVLLSRLYALLNLGGKMGSVTLGIVKLSVSGAELGGMDKALLVHKHTTGFSVVFREGG